MSTISFYTFFADQDSPHQKDMIDHLSPLISTGQIEELSDRDILPGPDRQAQVQQKIEEADMLVCLLSASFFSRDAGLVQVVDRLSKAGRMIIPIVIRSVDFSALELHKYQTLPRNKKAISEWKSKDLAWTEIAREIKDIAQYIRTKKKANIPKKVDQSPKTKPHPKINFKTVQSLIGQNQLEASIALLEAIINQHPIAQQDEFYLIKKRWSRLEQKANVPLINERDYEVEQNQIAASLLKLCRNLLV